MPLISPWRTAYGEDADIHSVLCRMSSGSVDAWGEASSLAAPCYSPEWAGGVFATARNWLAPSLIGEEITDGSQLQSRLAVFKGNQFAKAVLDSAFWCLKSRIENTPLHRLLGASRDEVPVGADFGVGDNLDDLLNDIAGAVEAGFPRVKLKFRPGWDIPMLEAVRHVFPEATIHIDCNSGYTLADAELFRDIDRFDLAMIEQPLTFDDVVDHAALQKQIRTPICLDESLNSLHRAEQAIRLESLRYANIKPGRVGGLTVAVAMHDRFQAAGIPCWVGGMLESAVGSSICTSLAMLDNFTYPADIFPSSRYYETDLADRPLELSATSDGTPTVRATDDIPNPHPERLRHQTVQHAVITP